MNRSNSALSTSLYAMNRWGLVGVAALLMLMGCKPKPQPLAPVKEPGEATGQVETTDPSRVDRVTKEIEEFAKPNEELHKIDRPDQKQWKPASQDAPVVKKGLGQLIDEGFANLDPTWVKVHIQCIDKGATLNMNPDIKIEDAKTFNIQFGLPETESWINSAVGDGKSRVLLQKNKRVELPEFKADQKAKPMNLAQIKDFIFQMPIKGFSAFTDDVQPWDGFVKGLEDPKNGFKVTVTEQKAAPTGEERPFYRLVAKRPGKESIEVEIIVDSKRNVPVTFRGNLTYPDSKTRMLFWQGAWSFGGDFEARDFRIPGK